MAAAIKKRWEETRDRKQSTEEDEEDVWDLSAAFKEPGCESGYLKWGTGNGGVQSHNWMLVLCQFFRGKLSTHGLDCWDRIVEVGTVGALRGQRDTLIESFSPLGSGHVHVMDGARDPASAVLTHSRGGPHRRCTSVCASVFASGCLTSMCVYCT